jgi:hypothetical protein
MKKLISIKKNISFILIILFLSIGFINSSFKNYQKYDLANLELKITKDSIDNINISILNNSNDSIKIVLPGDGSTPGWRTPTVRWSIIKIDDEINKHPENELPELSKELGYCKLINKIKLDEIITIHAQKEFQLSKYVISPYYYSKRKSKGKYSIKLYFKHDSKHGWLSAGYSGNEIKKIIKEETEDFFLVSNELIMEIK